MAKADNKIRLLFILWDLSRGGAQRMVLNLIDALEGRNYEASLIYIGENVDMQREFSRRNISVSSFSTQSLQSKLSTFRLLRSIRADIIHAHIPSDFFFIAFLCKFVFRVPVFQTFHRLPAATGFILRQWFSLLLVDKFISVSRYSQRRLLTQRPFLARKTVVINNGVLGYEGEGAKVENIDDNTFNIVTVANFHPLKGHIYALRAISALNATREQIRYHIIGGTYPSSETYRTICSYIEKNSLNDVVVMHGNVDNVFPVLEICHLFLLPSLQELFPVSILEAMLVGLPVISTSTGGIPEILGENNEYGICVAPKDSKALVKAIAYLYRNADRRMYYSSRSRERIAAFAAKKMADKYSELYLANLNKPRRGF